jgi:hypothetical protein
MLQPVVGAVVGAGVSITIGAGVGAAVTGIGAAATGACEVGAAVPTEAGALGAQLQS